MNKNTVYIKTYLEYKIICEECNKIFLKFKSKSNMKAAILVIITYYKLPWIVKKKKNKIPAYLFIYS